MMRCTIRLLSRALATCSLAVLGCGSGGGATQCNVGADCASGACSVTGQCLPVSAVEGGAPDASHQGDASAPIDTGTDSPVIQPLPGLDGGPSACVPNDDGTITREEVPMGVGLRATYLVADSVSWDTTGTVGDAATTRTWDLTGALAGDKSVLFTALTPTGTWWGPSYPAATFAIQLAASQSLLGVFQVDDKALSLIGIVSPTNAAPLTEITYATPIPTLKFPFSLGSTWTTTSSVTGTVSGVTFTSLNPYSETYVSTVDAVGVMKTPYATFPVLRVGTLLTQTVGAIVSYTQSFVWVAECFGPVAAALTASSQTKPSASEFTSDAEVRRLSP